MVSLVIFERSLFNYMPIWLFCIHNILTSHSLVSRVLFSCQCHRSFHPSEDLGVTLEVLVASSGTTTARLRVGPHLPTRTRRLLVRALYILSLTATTRSLWPTGIGASRRPEGVRAENGFGNRAPGGRGDTAAPGGARGFEIGVRCAQKTRGGVGGVHSFPSPSGGGAIGDTGPSRRSCRRAHSRVGQLVRSHRCRSPDCGFSRDARRGGGDEACGLEAYDEEAGRRGIREEGILEHA